MTPGRAALQERNECEEYLVSMVPPLRPFVATILLLMHELAKVHSLTSFCNGLFLCYARHQQYTELICTQGRESMYAPYLATLPASHNCTLGWEEHEKAELRGDRQVVVTQSGGTRV